MISSVTQKHLQCTPPLPAWVQMPKTFLFLETFKQNGVHCLWHSFPNFKHIFEIMSFENTLVFHCIPAAPSTIVFIDKFSKCWQKLYSQVVLRISFMFSRNMNDYSSLIHTVCKNPALWNTCFSQHFMWHVHLLPC